MKGGGVVLFLWKVFIMIRILGFKFIFFEYLDVLILYGKFKMCLVLIYCLLLLKKNKLIILMFFEEFF